MAWQAIGTPHLRVGFLLRLAEASGTVGRVAEGLTALAEALTVGITGGREAEWYRIKGDLLGQTGSRPEEAEACFQQALTIARRQQAKSLELRAALSLARLWQHQGKPAAAYAVLAPVYGWFTEGFETADLQEARGLLEELAGDHTR